MSEVKCSLASFLLPWRFDMSDLHIRRQKIKCVGEFNWVVYYLCPPSRYWLKHLQLGPALSLSPNNAVDTSY